MGDNQKNNRGAIRNEDAYARCKMLDHSQWAELLPRRITPSDGDMILANRNRILFIELSSKSSDWDQLSTGQRLLCEAFVRNGKGRQAAAVAKFVTPPDQQIDTVKDVVSFSFLVLDKGQLRRLGPYEGKHWPKACRHWLKFEDAALN